MAAPDPIILSLYLWWLSIALCILLTFRVWRLDLYRKYPFFFASLLVGTTSHLLLAAMAFVPRSPTHSFDIGQPYFWAWAVADPLSHFMSVLVVLELYSRVFGDYKGISTASRWALFTAVGISLAISLLILPLDLKNQPPAGWLRGTILQVVLVLDRGVTASLVAFLLLIALFLFWCPVPLCRNLILHCMVFSSLYFSQAALLLVRNMEGNESMASVNLMQECAAIPCLFVWIFWFTPRGELRKTRIRGPAPAARADALAVQLDALNAALLRAGRAPHK